MTLTTAVVSPAPLVVHGTAITHDQTEVYTVNCSRVGNFSKSHGSGRVGSRGLQIERVGWGRITRFSSLMGRVGSDPRVKPVGWEKKLAGHGDPTREVSQGLFGVWRVGLGHLARPESTRSARFGL